MDGLHPPLYLSVSKPILKMAKRLIVYLGIMFVMVIFLYLLSVVFTLLGVYRLNVMVMSAFFAPVIAWMIFPMCFWRPLSLRIILISLVCIFLGYGVSVIFVIANIGLPHHLSGPYGLFNLLIYSALPAIFFEWVNRFRFNWLFPNKALQRTNC